MSDFTHDRRGAYDPVSKDGLSQPGRVKDKMTPHQKEQWGADVRPEPLSGTEPVLPERLLRPATRRLNPRTGRRRAN
jgi:hypothetical protein